MRAAGGDYTRLSVGGGVVAIHIQWICNLDWDFMKYCLPKYELLFNFSALAEVDSRPSWLRNTPRVCCGLNNIYSRIKSTSFFDVSKNWSS